MGRWLNGSTIVPNLPAHTNNNAIKLKLSQFLGMLLGTSYVTKEQTSLQCLEGTSKFFRCIDSAIGKHKNIY